MICSWFLTNDSRVIKRSPEGCGFADREAKIVLDLQKALWARNIVLGLWLRIRANLNIAVTKAMSLNQSTVLVETLPKITEFRNVIPVVIR